MAALSLGGLPFAESPAPDATWQRVLAIAPKLISENAKERDETERELLALGTAAIEPLLVAAKASPGPVTVEIGRVLSLMGPDAVEAIAAAAGRQAKTHPYYQDHAWRVGTAAAGAMGARAVPKLVELFTQEGQRRAGRPFASDALRSMGPLAVEPLVTLLKHPQHDVRAEAATLLAGLGDPRSADALLEGMKSEDGSVRQYSAYAFAKIKDRRAIEPLLGLLRDTSGAIREHAAVALGRMYEPRFAEPLLSLAKNDPDVMVRRTAANILLRESKDPKVLREAQRYRIDRLPTAADDIRRRFFIIDVASGFVLTVLALIGTARGVSGIAIASCAALLLGAWLGPLGMAMLTAVILSLVAFVLGLVRRAQAAGEVSYWLGLVAVIAALVVGVLARGLMLAGRGV